jgi:hypothetical protein
MVIHDRDSSLCRFPFGHGRIDDPLAAGTARRRTEIVKDRAGRHCPKASRNQPK